MRTPQIVLFLVLLNSAAFGVTAMSPVDVTPNAGDSADIQEANESISETNPGATTGTGVLIGGFSAAMDAIDSIRNVVFYGPEMLTSLGAPAVLMNILQAAITFVIGYDVLQAFTGRQFS